MLVLAKDKRSLGPSLLRWSLTCLLLPCSSRIRIAILYTYLPIHHRFILFIVPLVPLPYLPHAFRTLLTLIKSRSCISCLPRTSVRHIRPPKQSRGLPVVGRGSGQNGVETAMRSGQTLILKYGRICCHLGDCLGASKEIRSAQLPAA